jgi:hypothetical protein
MLELAALVWLMAEIAAEFSWYVARKLRQPFHGASPRARRGSANPASLFEC